MPWNENSGRNSEPRGRRRFGREPQRPLPLVMAVKGGNFWQYAHPGHRLPTSNEDLSHHCGSRLLWNGLTDSNGQVSLTISGTGPVSGYYRARARARNVAGQTVGE